MGERRHETNVFRVVAVTNAFLPALRRSAHPRIVNLSSGTGSLTWSTGPNPQFDYHSAGTGFGAAYRSSKTALNALTVFYAQARAGGGGRRPTRDAAGRRPHRPPVLLGRNGGAMVNACSLRLCWASWALATARY
jgi:hypothetical protein